LKAFGYWWKLRRVNRALGDPEKEKAAAAAERNKEDPMKKQAFAVVILLGALMLAAGPVQAQSSFRVNIPFAFVAGETSLPAGEYIVQPPQIGGAKAVTLLRTDGDGAAMVLGMTVQESKNRDVPCLVFHRYDNGYFLSTMWTAGTSYGLQLRESRREVEIAKNETPKNVVLLASISTPRR
jgi:hypothetical protein